MDINTNRQSAAKLEFRQFPISLDGYEDKYKVTNDGRVWSEYIQDFMKPYYSKGGYMRIKVNYGDRNKKFMIHRLVALAFIENPDNKPHIDHIDCNRTNNCVDNLRWVTPKENATHALESGFKDYHKYKLTNSITGQVLEFQNITKACKYFGVYKYNSTLYTNANTNKPVTQGVFKDWIIERQLVKKVQRPSLAREQGEASRNGNSPNGLTRALIWSDLCRNIKQVLPNTCAKNREWWQRAILNI